MDEHTEPPLVLLSGVSHTYTGPPPVKALLPTDLAISRGDHVAIVGRSGSGKSTLLNILGLIERPTSGDYLLDGVSTGTMSEAQRTDLRATRIGLVFQAFHLLPHRTAEDNVALGLLYRGVGTRERLAAARSALEQVGLAQRCAAVPGQLSGGERQRVAIARALVGRPDLLLCDEPTGNLDSATAAAVLELIAQLQATGLTVVMITHDHAVAGQARRVLTITDGALTDGGART